MSYTTTEHFTFNFYVILTLITLVLVPYVDPVPVTHIVGINLSNWRDCLDRDVFIEQQQQKKYSQIL